ncbi:MAG TPA: hypothetical protein VGO93_20195, partial [Candidatus Xenobia bacterium]
MAAENIPLDNDPDMRVRQVRLHIETTRARMDGLVDEIHDRVTLESLKEATSSVAEAGVNAVWNALQPHVEEAKVAIHDTLDEAKTTVHDVATDTVRIVHDATIGKVQGAVHGVQDKVQGTVHGVRDKVRGQTHRLVDALSPYLQAGSLAVIHAMDAAEDRLTDVRRAWRSSDARPGTMKGVSMIIDTIKANPIAASIAGLSVAWIIAGPTVKSKAAPLVDKASSLAKDKMSDAQGKASDLASRMSDKASCLMSDVSNKTHDMLSTAQHKAQDLQGSASSMAQDTAGMMSDKLQGMGEGLGQFLHDNPFMVGGLCLCLGLGIGLMLPVTGPESNLLNQQRLRLQRSVQSTVGEVAESAKAKLHRASEAIAQVA